jgi:MFS transporter, OPA family, sugar phosphate sensor protein UhpC
MCWTTLSLKVNKNMKLFEFLKKTPAIPRLPENQTAQAYRNSRFQVFIAVYLGYAFFYLIRKNIAVVMPSLMEQLQLSKTQMGIILSLFSATYAIAKLFNGPLCDRSNPRYFMAVGLGGAAIVNLLFGFSSSILFFAVFWILNGYFQSMGSPIGPKTIANWFSTKERGRYYGIWNTCHNLGAFSILFVGGFIVEKYGWRYGFYLPGSFCILGTLYVAWKMLDRPETVGLPPIQEYHGDVPQNTVKDTEETAYEIFRKYVLNNPRIWLLSISCMLIYMVRYGLGDWGVTYLNEVKASSLGWAGLKSSFLELMGIPGTIIAGLVADRYFPRQNLIVAVIYLVGMCLTILIIYAIPQGYGVMDGVAFGLSGFFIYGAQMVCTGLGPLAMVPRRAVASAVGLTGAMSYLGAVITSTFSGWITQNMGWQITFIFWTVCAVFATLFLLPLIFGKSVQVEA